MDKYCKDVLIYLVKKGGCEYTVYFEDGLEEMALILKRKPADLHQTVRYLHEEGYIDYIKYEPSGIAAEFYLTHKGRYWEEFQRSEQMLYIADKWIDFLTMTASLFALIISIIALLT